MTIMATVFGLFLFGSEQIAECGVKNCIFALLTCRSLLMLRIYLPERYWEWSYIWRTEEEEGGGGGGTTEASTTTNSSAVLGS